jgi:hypothetical protein
MPYVMAIGERKARPTYLDTIQQLLGDRARSENRWRHCRLDPLRG